jgi:hypothetical protein
MATAQPDPELVPPSPGRKHHVNGSDRVSGTYTLLSILMASPVNIR